MRIFAVDDDQVILDLLADALRSAHFIPDTACSVVAAQRKLRGRRYDLVIIDWQFMPEERHGCDGITLVQQIRREMPDLPVLMLSGRGTLIDRVHGLRAGADDYLVKPFFVPELVARIQSLLRRGGRRVRRDQIALGGLVIDRINFSAQLHGRSIALTCKEFQLLLFLVEHVNTVLSRQQIIDELWREGTPGGSSTLDVHISFLRKKLQDCGIQIQTVRGIGFIFQHTHEYSMA